MQATEDKNAAVAQADKTASKAALAERLISNLAGENQRWNASILEFAAAEGMQTSALMSQIVQPWLSVSISLGMVKTDAVTSASLNICGYRLIDEYAINAQLVILRWQCVRYVLYLLRSIEGGLCLHKMHTVNMVLLVLQVSWWATHCLLQRLCPMLAPLRSLSASGW